MNISNLHMILLPLLPNKVFILSGEGGGKQNSLPLFFYVIYTSCIFLLSCFWPPKSLSSAVYLSFYLFFYLIIFSLLGFSLFLNTFPNKIGFNEFIITWMLRQIFIGETRSGLKMTIHHYPILSPPTE